MAVSILQSTGITPTQSGPASTTLTCTLPAPPTVGNLLVFLMAGDKDTGQLDLAGFPVHQHRILGADVSLYYYYRTSDGTEQVISPVWANASPAGNTAWYAELQDAAVTGGTYWHVSASASMPYSADLVRSRKTGLTGLTTHAGLAIGAWGVDDGGSVGLGVRLYSDVYTEVCTSDAAGLRGAIFAASKSVAQGVNTECTFSYLGLGTSTDQISGCVAVFSKLPDVRGYVAGTTTRIGTATGTVTHADAVTGSISSGTVTGSVSAVGSVTGTAAEAGEVEGESS